MLDVSYEAMMQRNKVTALPIPKPAQTAETCDKKALCVPSKRGPYKISGRNAKEADVINNTYFKW